MEASGKPPMFVASDNHLFRVDMIRAVHIKEVKGKTVGLVEYVDIGALGMPRETEIPSAESRQLINQLIGKPLDDKE